MVSDKTFYCNAVEKGLEVDIINRLMDLKELTGLEVSYCKTPLHLSPWGDDITVKIGEEPGRRFTEQELSKYIDELKSITIEPDPVATFNIGEAITYMEQGLTITRESWESGHLALQVPDEYSKMQQSYIYKGSSAGMVPWTATQEDLLAKDYVLIKD